MAINITTIPRKLKEAGYATHAVGKWNAGMATKFQTPEGRGYDSALTYFDMDTDFFTEAKPSCGTSKAPLETVDMWDTNGPGLGYNGTPSCSQSAQAGCTYQDEVFVQRIEKIVANLSADKPFFLFWAPHAPHDPCELNIRAFCLLPPSLSLLCLYTEPFASCRFLIPSYAFTQTSHTHVHTRTHIF